MIFRPPRQDLRPWVDAVWIERLATGRSDQLVPDGRIHLAGTLDGSWCAAGRRVDELAVHGPTDRAWTCEVVGEHVALGAVLRLGASEPLLGLRASDLRGTHRGLGWDLRPVRLASEEGEERTVEAFETLLRSKVQGPPPPSWLDAAGEALAAGAAVRDAAALARRTPRRFRREFGIAAGLAPSLYRRLQRVSRVLQHRDADPGVDWTRIALDEGFSDLAHLSRECAEILGVPPSRVLPTPDPTHFAPKRSSGGTTPD